MAPQLFSSQPDATSSTTTSTPIRFGEPLPTLANRSDEPEQLNLMLPAPVPTSQQVALFS